MLVLTSPGGSFYKFPLICNSSIIFLSLRRHVNMIPRFSGKAGACRDLTLIRSRYQTTALTDSEPRSRGKCIKMENKFIYSQVFHVSLGPLRFSSLKTETDVAQLKEACCIGVRG